MHTRKFSLTPCIKPTLAAAAFLFFLHSGYAAPAGTPADSGISHFVGVYFASWSKEDFPTYRSCFDPAATVTYRHNQVWRRWDIEKFLADQQQMQGQDHLLEVPLAIHIKAMQGDTAFVEVPWKLELPPPSRPVTGIDWYVLVRHDKAWRILNLTFWEDEQPAAAVSPSSGAAKPGA